MRGLAPKNKVEFKLADPSGKERVAAADGEFRVPAEVAQDHPQRQRDRFRMGTGGRWQASQGGRGRVRHQCGTGRTGDGVAGRLPVCGSHDPQSSQGHGIHERREMHAIVCPRQRREDRSGAADRGTAGRGCNSTFTSFANTAGWSWTGRSLPSKHAFAVKASDDGETWRTAASLGLRGRPAFLHLSSEGRVTLSPPRIRRFRRGPAYRRAAV